MIYRIEVSERRSIPTRAGEPDNTRDYELLDMEIELESFDFKRLLALLMDMMPASPPSA